MLCPIKRQAAGSGWIKWFIFVLSFPSGKGSGWPHYRKCGFFMPRFPGTKARLITNRFKNFLFVVDKVSNINDIFNYKDEFKTQTGVDAEKFKVLLDKGFILEEKINDSIDLFNINNEYLYS